jgi:hypothetical protein
MKRHCRQVLAVLCFATVAVPATGEAPKSGGILTFMIPADAPPSFDGAVFRRGRVCMLSFGARVAVLFTHVAAHAHNRNWHN